MNDNNLEDVLKASAAKKREDALTRKRREHVRAIVSKISDEDLLMELARRARKDTDHRQKCLDAEHFAKSGAWENDPHFKEFGERVKQIMAKEIEKQ